MFYDVILITSTNSLFKAEGTTGMFLIEQIVVLDVDHVLTVTENIKPSACCCCA